MNEDLKLMEMENRALFSFLEIGNSWSRLLGAVGIGLTPDSRPEDAYRRRRRQEKRGLS